MSHNMQTLLTVAAELRAVGHSWDTIAQRVQRKPKTCQKWPQRYRDQWDPLYREIQQQRFEETSNEAHTHLHAMMRGKDQRWRAKAIEMWLKCGAAAYGVDGALLTAAAAAQAGITDEQVRAFMDEQFDKEKAAMNEQRQRDGLPPLSEEEFLDVVNARLTPKEPIPVDFDEYGNSKGIPRWYTEKQAWDEAQKAKLGKGVLKGPDYDATASAVGHPMLDRALQEAGPVRQAGPTLALMALVMLLPSWERERREREYARVPTVAMETVALPEPYNRRNPVLNPGVAGMHDRIAYQGITFDDVLLEPGYSEVVPKDVDVRTSLTRHIRLHIPIVSSPMDTVTESELAIALAQEGGIGIIHKNLSIQAQTREVDKVKRSENGVISDPVTLPPDETVMNAKKLMEQHHISGVPITVNGLLKGILTRRDLRFLNDKAQKISEVMTKDNLVTGKENTTLEEAERILTENKVEKLLLVDDQYRLKGLITIKDIDKMLNFPNACKDARGRLRVGAAVGVMDLERADSLIQAGVDVLVVDSAHGHSKNVIQTVKEIKKRYKIDVIAGNIATVEGAKALADAGVDAVKCGIGPGSICTTRIVSGVGVPQLSAIDSAVQALKGTNIPIIADGGIRYSGDITKALAAGAHTVMIGGLFAGLAESPGQTILYKGRTFKAYRGMGSLGAMMAGSGDRYNQGRDVAATGTGKLVPEGVEGRVPYKGPLTPFLYQLVGGLRAGMGYCGTQTLEELRTRARFIQVTAASVQESHPHDILITQEAPNYSSREEYAKSDGM